MLTVRMSTPGQLGRFFVEALGLRIAYRRVERRHHAENAHIAPCIARVTGFQTIVDQREIGGRVARF